ncbi:MAG: hypothetical protein VZQ62_01050 [Methanosphaera sp.]|nr:hypothetical protein [Methanosphaera sp.]
MGNRIFTKRFSSYALQVYEKRTGKTPIDILDVGSLSMVAMVDMIRIGNGVNAGKFILSEEEASEKIDKFLDDENNTLIDVYIQLIDEYDRDQHILRKVGKSVDDIREEINKELNNNVDNSTEKFKNITANKVAEFPITDKVEATDKVRVTSDGMMTLDNEVKDF